MRFPGLILAIAITAVLGPSIFNIIVAIAVLYIPTYYRIVRGQTLSGQGRSCTWRRPEASAPSRG